MPAAAVIVAALAAGGLPTVAKAEETAPMPNSVQRWNKTAGAVALASCISPGNDPLHESRMYAISSLAAHDALNAIDRHFESYALRGVRARRASAIAAVAAASRTALTSAVRELPEDLFAECRPAALQVIEQAYTVELARVPDGRAKDRGVSARRRCRAGRPPDPRRRRLGHPDDGRGLSPGQQARRVALHPGPPVRLRSRVGRRAPLRPEGHRRLPGRTALPAGSAAYARDFAEVKAFGSDGVSAPSARTPDQTEVARFWIESSPLQWNRIARDVAERGGYDPWTSARLFALLNMSLADGYIASFSVKYGNPFWRPVTAIREAATDGNPATTADPDWTPLDITPPIPDHDSAHAVQGARRRPSWLASSAPIGFDFGPAA